MQELRQLGTHLNIVEDIITDCSSDCQMESSERFFELRPEDSGNIQQLQPVSHPNPLFPPGHSRPGSGPCCCPPSQPIDQGGFTHIGYPNYHPPHSAALSAPLAKSLIHELVLSAELLLQLLKYNFSDLPPPWAVILSRILTQILVASILPGLPWRTVITGFRPADLSQVGIMASDRYSCIPHFQHHIDYSQVLFSSLCLSIWLDT